MTAKTKSLELEPHEEWHVRWCGGTHLEECRGGTPEIASQSDTIFCIAVPYECGLTTCYIKQAPTSKTEASNEQVLEVGTPLLP